MKRISFFLIISLVSIFSFAQEITDLNGYHRSSLLLMPVVHMKDSFCNEIVYAARHMPFPDRYNHITDSGYILVRSHDYSNYHLVKDTTVHHIFDDVLHQHRLAKEIIKDWFMFDAQKGFSTQKIVKEGMYDASAIKQELARGTVSGSVNLADAGNELIGKSFILVNDMSYINHAERAQLVSELSQAISDLGKTTDDLGKTLSNTNTGLGLLDATMGLIGSVTSLVGLSAELVGDLTKSTTDLLDIKGFAVLEATYLYQLDWSEEVQNIFYSRYYTETGDQAKIQAFLNDTTTFRMKYIGSMPTVTNKTTVFNAGKYSKLSQNDQITITCARTMDDAINTLQTRFPDFRVYTPITDITTDQKGKVTGVQAKIGQKEGVTANKKYAIRQMVMNNGKTEYKDIVPSLKAETIWDNRFTLEAADQEENTINASTFKTKNNKLFKGMLLIEK